MEPEHVTRVRGEARYLDDLRLPAERHLAFVRSPHAHARVVGLDTRAAAAAPGVLEVVTAADLAAVRPVRAEMDPGGDYLYRPTDWHPIAADRVRYAGEIVAAVVAEDRYLAEDAAALVAVDYEPLAVAGTAAPGAPAVLHPGAPDNVLFRVRRETAGFRAALAGAALRVSGTFRHPRVAGVPMECCGILARLDPHTGTLEIWSPTQAPHVLRDCLAGCLGVAPSAIRVIAPDVGGGFGTKMHVFPEDLVAAWLALGAGRDGAGPRPVRWQQDRLEHLAAGFHARDVTVTATLALERDGTLVGLEARAVCDVGAYSAYPVTCSLEPQTIGAALPGPYRLPHYRYEGLAVATNKFPKGAYRGVGFPLAPLVTEGLMDRAARALRLDPAAIRRRNLLRPEELPARTASGATYDSGDYPRLLELALERAGYAELRAEQARRPPGGRRRLGVGIACFIEPTGMGRALYRARGMVHIPAFDAAVVRIDPAGHVVGYVSTPTQGQSQPESFRRILAGALGAPADTVRIVLGDTEATPFGSGTFASRSIVAGGGALRRAAAKLRAKLVRLAALHWGVAEDAVALGPDGARHGARRLTLPELAGLAYRPAQPLPVDLEPGLEAHAAYDPPGVAVSSAVHLAVVEVAERTGATRILRYVVAEDCGPMVNPRAVDGQIQGGVVQGIGCALLEAMDYDGSGQLRTSTLADYLVPDFDAAPAVEIVHLETPSPFTEGGYKGMGESGTIGAPAAVANAVLDALGIDPEAVVLPLTPERVLGWLPAARPAAAPAAPG